MTDQITQEHVDQDDEKKVYFMSSVTVTYSKEEEGVKRAFNRTVNILLSLEDPSINQSLIKRIQTNAASQVIAEYSLKPEDIVDIIINNIFPLGLMSLSEFTFVNAEPKEEKISSPSV